MARARRWAGALLLAAALAGAASARPAPDRAVPLARAHAAYDAMERSFHTGLLYAERTAAPREAAHAWPVSQAVAAAMLLASLPEGRGLRAAASRDLARLDAYWSPAAGAYSASAQPPAGPGGPAFYDDNEWIGLDHVAAYRLFHRRRDLARAEAILALVRSGWEPGGRGCPGGVYWLRSDENRDRNAVSTANSALLALELDAATGRRAHVAEAARLFRWVETCLRRGDGLIADHLRPDGSRDERAWSYNQGAMIAVAVRLAAATGDARYLDRADQIAAASFRAYGPAFAGEPRIFVAIFFRDLALLRCVRPDPAYGEALDAYLATQRGTGSPELLDGAALVQLETLAAA